MRAKFAWETHFKTHSVTTSRYHIHVAQLGRPRVSGGLETSFQHEVAWLDGNCLLRVKESSQAVIVERRGFSRPQYRTKAE